MTDQLKVIVQGLNAPPFNRTYNLISFDGLEPMQLLQVLSDVISAIQQEQSVDIRQEPSDQTALRIFTALRIMKYRPPQDQVELSEFRQGLVEGSNQSVYPVLEWMLQRVPELEQRAYLAKFLVRVEVPAEFLQDPEVEQLYAEVEELMEQFKEVHKEQTMVKSEGLSTEDIRQDLQSMELEKEQIGRRIDKMRKKAETAPQKEEMLEIVALLRNEGEREFALNMQKAEQRNGLVHAEQKIQRLQHHIREIKQQAESARPEDLIKKLEEENQIHSYMVNEKLPKEINSKRKAVQELRKVLDQPMLSQQDLDEINTEIEQVNNEMKRLVEQKNLASDPNEDKLAIFRQQAIIVERKKENAAERLTEAKKELILMENDVRDKKNQMRDPDGNEIVTSVQFKNYVNKLRGKTNVYKKKRAELQDLRAEIGVLSRTEEIMRVQMEQIRRSLDKEGLEYASESDSDDEGVILGSGHRMLRPMTANVKGKSVEQLRDMVEHLLEKMAERKGDLQPLLNELRPLREQYQKLCDVYGNKKQQYETAAASMESGYSRLEQEVKGMRSRMNEDDSQFYALDVEKKVLGVRMEVAEKDVDSRDGFLGRLNKRIAEAEREGKKLEEEKAAVKEDQADSARQMKLWRDLARIMEGKKTFYQQRYPNSSAGTKRGTSAVSQNERQWSAGSQGKGAQIRPGSARPSSGRPGSGTPGSRAGSGRPGTGRRGGSAVSRESLGI